MSKKKVVIYHSSIIRVGGIETFIYNFIKRMNDKVDLTLYFGVADNDKLIKYSEYVDCIKFENQKIECDVLLLMSSWGKNILGNVKAEKKILTIHANYEEYAKMNYFHFKKDDRVTHYVSVSKDVQGALKRLHGIDSDVIYNLIDNTVKPNGKQKNKKLTFITACRLSQEKGIERCIELAKEFKFDYEWNIYGGHPRKEYVDYLKKLAIGTKIKFHGVKYPIIQEIEKADYLVQASNTEGYCYSIQEALQVKTPCIITPFPSGAEQIQDGINGYIIPFDVKGFNAEKFKKIPVLEDYKEKSNEKDWLTIFNS